MSEILNQITMLKFITPIILLLLSACSFISYPDHEVVNGEKISKEWELFVTPSPNLTIDAGYSPTLSECKEKAQQVIEEKDFDLSTTKYICGTKCVIKWDDRSPSDCSIQEQCLKDECTRI